MEQVGRRRLDHKDKINNKGSCLKCNINLKSFLLVLELIEGVKLQNIFQYLPAKIYLESFAFELNIKIFYELDLGCKAPEIHEIDRLFCKLNEESKNFIKNKFDDINIKNIKRFKNLHKNLDIYEPNFEEVLKNNSEIVKNFKYTPKLPNGSIVSLSFLCVLYKKIEDRINNFQDQDASKS